MKHDPLPAAAIVLAGTGLGFTGDFLLRAPGEPGLNLALLFAGLAASVLAVSLQGGSRLSREASVLVGVGVLSAAGLAWRGSELLRGLAVVAAASAFALAALHGGRAWLRRGRVADLIEAVVASGVWSGLGSLRLVTRTGPSNDAVGHARSAAGSVARSALTGVLLAAPPLVVFGALFVSADPVFAGAVEELVRIDLRRFASHLAVGGILSWLACGYFVGFTTGTRLDRVRDVLPARPSLGTAEVAMALELVDALFLGFVVVQFRYLFGGAAWVEVTPGVTYAAYARQGFFQLVVATGLGLPWLLVADALSEGRKGLGRWVVRTASAAQLLLLLGIIASAAQRMRAYLHVYGLTEDRFVAMAMLGWLALLVLWFGATVLRGRRSRFAFGALVSAYGLVAFLFVADPAARAARSHLDRTGSAGSSVTGSGGEVDVRYLASLGSDAAPVLVGRLDQLDDAGRCRVARSLLARWGSDRTGDWRSWNVADERARELVAAERARLHAAAGAGATCG